MIDPFDIDPSYETIDCDGKRVVAGAIVVILSLPENAVQNTPNDEGKLKLASIGKKLEVVGVGKDGYAWFEMSLEEKPGMIMSIEFGLKPMHFRCNNTG